MNFKINRLRRVFGAAASAALLSGLAVSAQPFSDPAGTWDCVMSGGRNGLAMVTFEGNTFSMFEILVPKKQVVTTSKASRGGDVGRGDSTPGTNVVLSVTNLFGAGDLTGTWNFDVKGRIMGHFIESSAPVSCTTNTVITAVTETNGGTVTTTFSTNTTVDCTGAVTNAFSFVGTVVPGKRLTLVCDSSIGKVTYRGIPAVTLPDASGSYYGDLYQNGQHFSESLTMSPEGGNIYDVVGDGPGYSYNDGVAIVSAWKKIAFAMTVEPTNLVTRAVVGSFNSKKLSSRTTGLQEPPGEERPRVRFNVDMLPTAPPAP